MARYTKFKSYRKHTNPNCQCIACLSRRRKAEADAIAAGAGGVPVASSAEAKQEVLDPDMPVLHVKGRTKRDRVLEWMELRVQNPGISNAECSRRMGLSPNTLKGYIYQATKEGWLKFNDPVERIDNEIVPKVLENLISFLDDKDKQVTIETAKGTVFKTYQEAKGITENPSTVLALKIEMPDPTLGMKISAGHIVGRPKEIKAAEIINEEKDAS